jgi:hypothetical protein
VSMASARAVAILNLPRFRGSATLPLLLRTFKLPGGPVDLPPDVDATLKPLPQSTISVDVDSFPVLEYRVWILLFVQISELGVI